MTEAELILAWGEISAHIWTIVQFWASISFGVIAISHFAFESLNRYLVILVIGLYTLFSIYCMGFFLSDIELLLAMYEEAEVLLTARNDNAIFLTAFANYPPVKTSAIFIFVGFPSVYMGSVAYLIYRFRVASSGGGSGAS